MKRYILLAAALAALFFIPSLRAAAQDSDKEVSALVERYGNVPGMRVSTLGKSLVPLMQGMSSFLSELTGENQEIPDVSGADRIIIMDYTGMEDGIADEFSSALISLLSKGKMILGTGDKDRRTGVWSFKKDGEGDGSVIVHYPDMRRVLVFVGDSEYEDKESPVDDPDRLF